MLMHEKCLFSYLVYALTFVALRQWDYKSPTNCFRNLYLEAPLLSSFDYLIPFSYLT